MDPELEWVDPDTPAEEIGGRILERHPRFVLVGEPAGAGAERRAVGLITRMQVLRHLHGRLEAFDDRIARRSEGRAEERKGIGDLFAELSPALAHRIEVAAQVARRHRLPVYLVGGLVRDLLLRRDNRDLDRVVVGDGPHFAHLVAAELGGRVREHREFLTAVVFDAEGLHVDVATARSEFYRAPAALPEVETSAIRQDLYRRDFTINTLAIQLGPGDAPVLIDFFGGRRDLDNGVIRVIHSLSLIDDPTRVLRAVRLEQRLGFAISPETLQLVEVALTERIFDRLTGSRLREELILLLDDPAVALRGVERLASLELLAVLHPGLALTDAVRARLREALASFDWYRFEGLQSPPVVLWRLVLAAVASDLDDAAVEALADRLQLSGDDRRVLVGGAARRARAAVELEPAELAPHRIAAALAGLPGEDLLLLAGGGPRLRERVRRDLTELRRFRLAVRGADLVAAGVEPGPAIGLALERTREARLDGAIPRDDELPYALATAREAAAEAGEEKDKSWVRRPEEREAGAAAGSEDGR
jgi:tRNA nucleotidyltransferase (CCA-adding enzyme)